MADTPMTLAVFGAAGKTGGALVAQAVDRGHAVRAIEPEWPREAPLPTGAEAMEGNLLDGDLHPLIEGCDAVISAIGLGLSAKAVLDPPPLYSTGTGRLLTAMERAKISRLVVISATFVATRDRGPAWFRATAGVALDAIFTQMGEMERILRASRADWTAVRPGWLLDAPLTADYVVTPDLIAPDLIRTRHADLAHFMLYCAESGDWSRATPAIARPEPAHASTPDKLLKEVAG